tara:strand:- start:274 stop:1959 length:1686 start_codon:yes stop_codon:yes gene_type:complete
MATLEERLALGLLEHEAAQKAESTPDWSEVPGLAWENTPESAGRLASGIWEMISNPVDTFEAIVSLAGGVASKLIPGLELDETSANAFGEFMVDRYGGVEGDAFSGLRTTLAEDPVGVLADLASILTAGSGAVAGGASTLSRLSRVANNGSPPGPTTGALNAIGAGANRVGSIASYVDPIGLPFRVAGGVIGGLRNRDASLLAREGVSPTMGQALGGPVGQLEEVVGTVPVLGSAIAAGRSRAQGQFNQAAYNRALRPIGQKADKTVTGDEAIAQVSDALSNAYDDLLPKLTLTPDDILLEDIARLVSEAKKIIGPAAASSLDRVLLNSLDPYLVAPISGTKFKAVEATLGNHGKIFSGSTFPDQRLVGDAISDIQTALRDALKRSNPQHAAALRDINTGYANYARLRNAGAKVPSGESFTPGQLASSVRASDKTVGKGASAKGRALMQDLSRAGLKVLGDKVRSSGTTERAVALGGLGALATGVVPGVDPMMVAALAGTAVPYLPGAQGAMAAALLKRPPGARSIGGAVRRHGPILGHAGYQATQPKREGSRALEARLRM